MTLRVTVLFDRPQQEIASHLRRLMGDAVGIEIITGFATPGGIGALAPALRTEPTRLRALVVGKATRQAFEALERLIGHGVPADRLFIHLGHAVDDPAEKHGFHRYHPMLHGKVYLMDLSGGRSVAVLGSHNLTGFALTGLNAEASVLLEGPSEDSEFTKIRAHIAACRAQAVPYDSAMKEAYTWWASAFTDGLREKIVDDGHGGEKKQTILVLAEAAATRQAPRQRETLYFEIPANIPQIYTLNTEVHLFVFDRLPPTPREALLNLGRRKYSRWCITRGLDKTAGGRQIQADWAVQDRCSPRLEPTRQGYVQPRTSNAEQVRAQIYGEVQKRYEYVFEGYKPEWRPLYGEPPLGDDGEAAQWQLVRGLAPASGPTEERIKQALVESSPESGSFILVSQRRQLLVR